MLSVTYAECCLLFMLIVIVLSVIVLNVVYGEC
jgi:hypothetical protein